MHESDIYYLRLAVEKYGTQLNLARVLTFIINKLGREPAEGVIEQRRISAWIYVHKRVPAGMVLPLSMALRRAGVKVRLCDINARLYPETVNPDWLKRVKAPRRLSDGSVDSKPWRPVNGAGQDTGELTHGRKKQGASNA